MESNFSGIKYHIENITDECEAFPKKVNYDDDFDKVKFISDDSLPLGKLTVVIRCVLKQGDLFYPQVYLDDALYQSYK